MPARSATKEGIVEVRGSVYRVNGVLILIYDPITSDLHINFGHASNVFLLLN